MYSAGLERLFHKPKHLVAYWPLLEEPGPIAHSLAPEGELGAYDLSLESPPTYGASARPELGQAIYFSNNHARAIDVDNFPEESFTVEFWCKDATPLENAGRSASSSSESSQRSKRKTNSYSTWFSYAARVHVDQSGGTVDEYAFWEEAVGEHTRTEYNSVLIWRRNTESWAMSGGKYEKGGGTPHVIVDGERSSSEDWPEMKDGEWHHIGITWERSTGELLLFIDGLPSVSQKIAPGSRRSKEGSLVLGQDQDCYGGCFETAQALNGAMDELRIWSVVRTPTEIRGGSFDFLLPGEFGPSLALYYTFDENKKELNQPGADGFGIVPNRADVAESPKDREKAVQRRSLSLGAEGPLWQDSSAPLHRTHAEQREVGIQGRALRTHEETHVIISDFSWPSEAFTFEIWVRTTDSCNDQTIAHFATAENQRAEHAMETDHRTLSTFQLDGYDELWLWINNEYHVTGVTVADGTWHQLTITWESESGEAVVYDNGRIAYVGTLSPGKPILKRPGSFTIGSEMDCIGGCIDPMQAFVGEIDEVRLWSAVATSKEVAKRWYEFDVSPGSKGLVAYWKFDEHDGAIVTESCGSGKDLVLSGAGDGAPGAYTVPSRAGRYVPASAGSGFQGGLFAAVSAVAMTLAVGGAAFFSWTYRHQLLHQCRNAASWVQARFGGGDDAEGGLLGGDFDPSPGEYAPPPLNAI
mmetsp:Transcript_25842/g.85033  ORF Transcript_25842/g.85033 Transcript_25842/m.85033 type:complete len:697 (+) Transcript_25842:438-2528(+)